MRPTALLLLAATAIAGLANARETAPAAAPSPPIELRIMTYNIRYGTAPDRANLWEFRKDILVDSIQMFDPHLIGAQEVYLFQAEWLDAQFPRMHWYGIQRADGIPETGGNDELSAIFFVLRDFLPIEQGTFWLSETPDEWGSVGWDAAMARSAAYTKFLHQPTRQVFWFYNTHYDHIGAVARENSTRTILAHIDAHVPEGDPVIVVGDFNTTAEKEAPWQVFIDAGFKDAWLEAPERRGPAATWGAFNPPDYESDRRIDWILYRGPVEALEVETVTHNQDGRYPSDHFPVYARLRVGAPGQDTETARQ